MISTGASGTGALILAGGKSRRMKTDKAFLRLGNETFIGRLIKELRNFPELLISAAPGNAALYKTLGVEVIEDSIPDCGPMGGLLTALNACRSGALLAVSCDFPFFNAALAERLADELCLGDYDAVIPVTRDGVIQPLCAIYRKTCADVFSDQIKRGEYKMQDALKMLDCSVISTGALSFHDAPFFNVNTPEDYDEALKIFAQEP